jgi:hypothetical protein
LIEASDLSIKDGDLVLTDDVTQTAVKPSVYRNPGPRGKYGDSTKTAYKPYDDVVTAILIRATQLLGSDFMDQGGREGEEIISH